MYNSQVESALQNLLFSTNTQPSIEPKAVPSSSSQRKTVSLNPPEALSEEVLLKEIDLNKCSDVSNAMPLLLPLL